MRTIPASIIGLIALAAAFSAACDDAKPTPGTVPAGTPGVTGAPQTPATPVRTDSTSIAGTWVSDFEAMYDAWVAQRIKDNPAADKAEARTEAKAVVAKLLGEDGVSVTFNDDGTLTYLPSSAKGTFTRTGDVITFRAEGSTWKDYKLQLKDGKLVHVPQDGDTPGIGLVLRRK